MYHGEWRLERAGMYSIMYHVSCIMAQSNDGHGVTASRRWGTELETPRPPKEKAMVPVGEARQRRLEWDGMYTLYIHTVLVQSVLDMHTVQYTFTLLLLFPRFITVCM